MIETLRALRDERGLTRAALAPKIGCGLTTLVKWEHGTCVPSLQALHDWCKALNLDLIVDRDDL